MTNKTNYKNIFMHRKNILLDSCKNMDRSVTHKFHSKKIKKEDLEKSSILIWINTFERSRQLKNLLNDISNQINKFKIKIMVIDDCSISDYITTLKEFEGKLDIEYFKVSFNHGKRQYWKLCNYALTKIKESFSDYDYYIKLDDDCRLVNNFFIRCINIWENITDKKKICLNFRLDSREGTPVWTNVLPKRVIINNIPLYLAQWVDMDFMCTRKMFNVLHFKIDPQNDKRWENNPNMSSGVGRNISLRLYRKRYNLYLTTESLVIHDHHDSKMNPDERNNNPLVTKEFRNISYGLPI